MTPAAGRGNMGQAKARGFPKLRSYGDRAVSISLSLPCLLFFAAVFPWAIIMLAGWLRKRATASSPSHTPLETAKAAVASMTSEQLREFRRWLDTPDAPGEEPHAPRPSEGASRGQSGITS